MTDDTRIADSKQEPQAAQRYYLQTLFALPASYPAVPLDDGSYAVTTPVAICSYRERTVSLVVELAPTTIECATVFELSFSVLVVDETGSEPTFATQDRDAARPYLPTDVIALIMPLVCASVSSLLDCAAPQLVYRVTKGRDLPEKAMEKHHMVTGAVQSCGYEIVDKGTDQFGRTFWLMEKG